MSIPKSRLVDSFLATLKNRGEFESLFDHLPDVCFFVKDSQSRLMMGNQALLRLLRQDSFETVSYAVLSVRFAVLLHLACFEKSDQFLRMVCLDTIRFPSKCVLPAAWIAFVHDDDRTCIMAGCDKGFGILFPYRCDNSWLQPIDQTRKVLFQIRIWHSNALGTALPELFKFLGRGIPQDVAFHAVLFDHLYDVRNIAIFKIKIDADLSLT